MHLQDNKKSSFWDKFSEIDYCTLEIQLLTGLLSSTFSDNCHILKPFTHVFS